jgi:hypothetical protein
MLHIVSNSNEFGRCNPAGTKRIGFIKGYFNSGDISILKAKEPNKKNLSQALLIAFLQNTYL